MALNSYPAELVIRYDYITPTRNYGFALSGSSFGEEIMPFGSKQEREDWIRSVNEAAAERLGAPFDSYDREMLATLAAFIQYGDFDEWDLLLRDEYPALFEDTGDDFDFVESLVDIAEQVDNREWDRRERRRSTWWYRSWRYLRTGDRCYLWPEDGRPNLA